jgi:hypothetical protein
MSEAPWKRVERQVAALLGGRRVPVPGRHGAGADPGDVAGTPFFVEVRARRRCDLFVWWHHTRADAAFAGRTPLLVIRDPRRGGELLAVLRLADLAEVLHARDGAPLADAPRPGSPGLDNAARPGPPGANLSAAGARAAAGA